MRLLLLIFCLIPFGVMSVLGVANATEIGLISPEQAAELLIKSSDDDKPIVIDTRGGYKDYFRSHIVRAHHLNFDTLRGTDNGVPVQYLPDNLMVELLNRAGIQRNRLHLIYATGDVLPNDEVLSASMVAYVLEKYGVEKIKIIDGGLAEWQKRDLPVTQDYFGNSIGNITYDEKQQIGICINDLLVMKAKTGSLLVDARPFNEYVGEDDVWLRKGHIPGAISFHWAKLMEKDNTHKFLPLQNNMRELEKAGITKDKDIVVYCGTSREGSLLRFYLRYVAGYPKVRLYEGSWKEYAALKDLPAETIPMVKR
jgi:thiosulfate/3-mercaptopyruvate sulfurtransferase